MKIAVFLSCLLLYWNSGAAIVDLTSYVSPEIKGDTLYIYGTIDGHIYDYFAYNAKKMDDVKVIELISFGGKVDMALDIAEKIKALKKITRIGKGGFCASACVPLFAAGVQRQMASDAWIGIHAARRGAYYAIQFDSLCKSTLADGSVVFDATKEGCQDFLKTWYDKIAETTDKMFTFYEDNGTSRDFRKAYFELPLLPDDKWIAEYNIMKTPDWVVSPELAKHYNLATEIIP
jgi:ATP-dependent protease ClpP protease subunit